MKITINRSPAVRLKKRDRRRKKTPPIFADNDHIGQKPKPMTIKNFALNNGFKIFAPERGSPAETGNRAEAKPPSCLRFYS